MVSGVYYAIGNMYGGCNVFKLEDAVNDVWFWFSTKWDCFLVASSFVADDGSWDNVTCWRRMSWTVQLVNLRK